MEAILEEREALINAGEGVTETIWHFSVPPYECHDRIGLRRINYGHRERKGEKVLLYLPGTWGNGTIWTTDERYEFRLYLAKRGIEVYSMDYRTHFVPRDYSDDLSFMMKWTTRAFLEDIARVISFTRKEVGGERIYLAGMSRGALFSYLYAENNWKEDLKGLIILDGGIRIFDTPATHSLNLAEIITLLEKGEREVIDGRLCGILKRLGYEMGRSPFARESKATTTLRDAIELALKDPYAPGPEREFNTVMDYLFSVVRGMWGPGVLTNLDEGYGNISIIVQFLSSLDRYWPTVQEIEWAVISDHDMVHPELPYGKHIADVDIPVIAFLSTGLGSVKAKEESARKMASKDVEVHVLDGWGHNDVLHGEFARERVFEPMFKWILRH